MSTNTNFAEQVLSVLNKDEESVQKETVLDTIEEYKIQCETQIGFLNTSSAPQLKLKKTQLERELAKSKKELENSYLDLSDGNFKKYIGAITKSEDLVASKEEELVSIKEDIKDTTSQVAKYKALLEKLNS